MKVVLLGTGAAIPIDGRAQSGVLVESGPDVFLIDCGSGVLNNLVRAGYQPAEVRAVFFTHLHPDHMSDIIALTVARKLTDMPHLTLYGPPGLEECFRHLIGAYPDVRESTEQDIYTISPPESVLLSNTNISLFPTQHGSINSHGFIVESNSGKVVISGDNAASKSNLLPVWGANLLVHECALAEGTESTEHTSPIMLAHALRGSDIKNIVLVHLYQETHEASDNVLTTIKNALDRTVEIGNDLDVFNLEESEHVG